MFPEAAELKDELRTRMLQARTREGAEPSDMRDSTHPREAATPLDPGLALLGPREGLAIPTETPALLTEEACSEAGASATPNTNPYY